MKIPALKKPTLVQLQNKWSWIKSIEKDDSPTGGLEFELTTVLTGNETSVSGQEYEKRLIGTFLGFQHVQWIEKHQDEISELGKLKNKGVWYIDFPGLIVVSDDGDRGVACLVRNGERRYLGWRRFDDGFYSRGRVASKYNGTLKPEPLSALGSLVCTHCSKEIKLKG